MLTFLGGGVYNCQMTRFGNLSHPTNAMFGPLQTESHDAMHFHTDCFHNQSHTYKSPIAIDSKPSTETTVSARLCEDVRLTN